ncbi:MAG: hypothetical protein RSB55_07315, partial [Oscillospiraceae bacterium]
KAAEVAAADYFTAPLKTLSLTQIDSTSPFYLKADGAGSSYAAAASFARAMKDLAKTVAAAADPVPDGNKDVKNLSWAQVQYYLINSRYVDKATANPLIADTPQTYWWYQGGSKPVEAPSIKNIAKALLQY